MVLENNVKKIWYKYKILLKCDIKLNYYKECYLNVT